MTKIDLLEMITRNACEYSQNAKASLLRNNHMNEIEKDTPLDQKIIDAVLVDFINYIGMQQGVDYALNTSDLPVAQEHLDKVQKCRVEIAAGRG